jgi:hypothetical protein
MNMGGPMPQKIASEYDQNCYGTPYDEPSDEIGIDSPLH